MCNHWLVIGETDIEDEPIAADGKLQRVRTAVVVDRPELVVFEQVVDRHPALVLDVIAAAAERGFVESHCREPAGIVFARGSPRHHRLSRIVTERACASSPSSVASVIAASASGRNWSGPHLQIEVRFMKSSTPRPEENRAARAVGNT